MPEKESGTVEIRVAKVGPTGKPYAEVLLDEGFNVTNLGTIIEKVTRNKDLREKLGLRGCGACKSGMDFTIRDRFEEAIRVNLAELGIRELNKGAA